MFGKSLRTKQLDPHGVPGGPAGAANLSSLPTCHVRTPAERAIIQNRGLAASLARSLRNTHPGDPGCLDMGSALHIARSS